MKRTLRFLVPLLCSLFCLFNMYSQENFQSAYIVNLNNDTIKGLIDIRTWSKTPKIIRFKESPDSEIEKYKPYQIQSFGVSNEVYQSAIVTIDISPFRDSELPYSDQPENITDTVFLQVLIQGIKSLYYLKDNNTKEHYFIYQDSIYKTLFYKKYLKNIDEKKQSADYTQIQGGNGTAIKTINKYRNQLSQYLQDCPSLQPVISTASYTRSDLIRLFKKYYATLGKQSLYEFKKDKFKSEFGLLTGLSLTTQKFSGDELFEPFIDVDYPFSQNITFGVFYNFVFPRNKGRWAIANELVYTSYKFNTQYRDTYDSDIYTDYTISLGSELIKLNIFLQYKIPIKKVNLYLKGGISRGIVISQTNYMKIEDHVYSVTDIQEKAALKYTNKGEKGYAIGLRTSIKKFSIEGRYERASGMSAYLTLSSIVYRYLFIISYTI